jgi:divalent metal cation (Fe/Co/Zn/Cd) transporter
MQLALPQPWEARAIWLARATVAWNIVEGLVALAFGLQEESVALLGFGLDSWVEVGSALVVLRKLQRPAGCAAERRAQEQRARAWISGLFLVLAGATALGGAAQLLRSAHPENTLPGLVISLVSLSIMVLLWRAKERAAAALGSKALAMDAACSKACIQLSVVLLSGSAIYAVWPALWWADAAASLGLSALIAREGWEGWRSRGSAEGGGCGCSGG